MDEKTTKTEERRTITTVIKAELPEEDFAGLVGKAFFRKVVIARENLLMKGVHQVTNTKRRNRHKVKQESRPSLRN